MKRAKRDICYRARPFQLWTCANLKPFRDGLFCTNTGAKSFAHMRHMAFNPSLDLVTKQLRQNGSNKP